MAPPKEVIDLTLDEEGEGGGPAAAGATSKKREEGAGKRKTSVAGDKPAKKAKQEKSDIKDARAETAQQAPGSDVPGAVVAEEERKEGGGGSKTAAGKKGGEEEVEKGAELGSAKSVATAVNAAPIIRYAAGDLVRVLGDDGFFHRCEISAVGTRYTVRIIGTKPHVRLDVPISALRQAYTGLPSGSRSRTGYKPVATPIIPGDIKKGQLLLAPVCENGVYAPARVYQTVRRPGYFGSQILIDFEHPSGGRRKVDPVDLKMFYASSPLKLDTNLKPLPLPDKYPIRHPAYAHKSIVQEQQLAVTEDDFKTKKLSGKPQKGDIIFAKWPIDKRYHLAVVIGDDNDVETPGYLLRFFQNPNREVIQVDVTARVPIKDMAPRHLFPDAPGCYGKPGAENEEGSWKHHLLKKAKLQKGQWVLVRNTQLTTPANNLHFLPAIFGGTIMGEYDVELLFRGNNTYNNAQAPREHVMPIYHNSSMAYSVRGDPIWPDPDKQAARGSVHGPGVYNAGPMQGAPGPQAVFRNGVSTIRWASGMQDIRLRKSFTGGPKADPVVKALLADHGAGTLDSSDDKMLLVWTPTNPDHLTPDKVEIPIWCETLVTYGKSTKIPPPRGIQIQVMESGNTKVPWFSIHIDDEAATKRLLKTVRAKLEMATQDPKKWIHNATRVEYFEHEGEVLIDLSKGITGREDV